MELPQVDMDYIQQWLEGYKSRCQKTIDESNPSSSSLANDDSVPTGRITIDDRLRLIEAFLSDEAKPKLIQTQECLTRQELDARNSDSAVTDYFAAVAKVFNDETWVPTLLVVYDLHPSLEEARELPLKEGGYRATRAKVKDKFQEMKNQLHSIVVKWELSGNGGGQRDPDAPDFGHFDLEEAVDGDNRRNFLPDNNDNLYYLLYFWHRLEEENYLQLTLAKFPDSVAADSDTHHATVPAWISGRRTPTKDEKIAEKLSAPLASMSEEIKQGNILEERKIEEIKQGNILEERKYARTLKNDVLDLEVKMSNMGTNDPSYAHFHARKRAIEEEITEIEQSIAKRQK
jgi:hypothetical protein